jgi:hypothetical protein
MEKEPIHNQKHDTAEEKKFLYHRVPEKMEGTVLYPLNELKDVHEEAYEREVKKYEGREHVMKKIIPTLDAAWNDVLHFSPVHPAELKNALEEAGLHPKEMKFYQVDPSLLDASKTTIWLFNDGTNEEKMNPEYFTPYDPKAMGEHSTVPEQTKEYYRRMAQSGQKHLTFIGIPHILHKGSIDISNLPVISV